MTLDVTPELLGRSAVSNCRSNAGEYQNCVGCGIRRFAVCGALAENELPEIEAIVQTRRYEPRQTIFQEGDTAHAIYTITGGTVRLQRDLPDGRRQVIGFAVPGDFIGLSLEESFTFSADMLTKGTICAFDRTKFTGLLTKKPALMHRLHAIASHELGIAQEQMVLLGRRRADERVAAFLMSWGQRMRHPNGVAVTLPLPMGRQDIADYLGLTIETVSRTLSRFFKERILLDVPHGVRVLDPERLRAVVV